MPKYVVANWKMNLGDQKGIDYFKDCVSTSTDESATLVVCPPFTVLRECAAYQTDMVRLGAQNCAGVGNAAQTGEISAAMLKDAGCRYVILGHSERRHLESDEDVFQKALHAQAQGITPIICVGEQLEDRQKNRFFDVIQTQLTHSLKDLKGCMIAYEPVWAIGTGLTPSLDDIQDVLNFIKTFVPPTTPLLYGGSVHSNNATAIASIKLLDGVLVGGASLDLEAMTAIVHTFQDIK